MDLFVITRSPCGLDLLWRDNFSAALGTSWRASGARGGERLFNELGGGDILIGNKPRIDDHVGGCLLDFLPDLACLTNCAPGTIPAA